MTRGFIKYFLSLSILLLSVYSNLYADTYQEGNNHSYKSTLVRSEKASLGNAHYIQSLLHQSDLSVAKKESLKLSLAEIEEEDDKLLSFKKYLETSNYLASVFYAFVLGCLALFLLKRLPSCKHSLNFYSFKLFLLFRVIRI